MAVGESARSVGMPIVPELRLARRAVGVVFFSVGIATGSWVPHIPEVQVRLGLGPALLGIALLCVAVGALIAMPVSGAVVARRGSRFVTLPLAFANAVAMTLPILAPSLPTLMLALFTYGMTTGAVDVAMNAHGVVVQNRYRRPVMSTFHALWSLGALCGAAAGALALRYDVPPAVHALSAAAFMMLIVLLYGMAFLPSAADAGGAKAQLFVLPKGPTLALGLLGFFAMVSEGAVLDWSAVYLRDALSVGAGVSAIGFAAFAATMSIGRFTGDTLVHRFGSVATLRFSSAAAAIGMALAVSAPEPIYAYLGFALTGFGLANMVPLVFTAAGDIPGLNAGSALAAVSTAGYTGFLAGPPLIGFVAEEVGIGRALWLIVAACLPVFLFSGVVRPRRR